MKKAISIVAVALMASSVAMAANQMAWSIPYGVYDHEATDLTAEGGILQNYDVLWQLIYAGPNDTIDPVGTAATDYVTGDDSVLDHRIFNKGSATDTLSGNTWDDLALFTTDDSITVAPTFGEIYDPDKAYYVYQRVYESQTPVDGTYYFESDLVAIGPKYAASIQSFPIVNYDDHGIKTDKIVNTTPEPATMSLLGLGALAMVLRRKLRK
jgi:hypothetical protein